MIVYDGSVKAILHPRPSLRSSLTWKIRARGMNLTVIITTCEKFGSPDRACPHLGVLFFSSFDSITAVLMCRDQHLMDYDDISVEYVDHYCLSFPEETRKDPG